MSFSPESLGLAILGSDDISQSIIIGDDQCSYFLIQYFILLEYLEEFVPFFCILLFEIIVRNRKIDEKLVSVYSLPDDEMSKESLMGHLVMDREF